MAKKINIKGPIIPSSYQRVYDWFGIEATSPKRIGDLLEEANGDDVEVEINSGGGSVPAGSEIYTALKSYKGNSKGKIVGLAASAASVIAMGCKHLSMSPTGQLMIHNSSTSASGDYRDMEHTAEVLKTVNETIANAYRLRTGKTQEELLALMDNETWMSAKKAKELGFIDEIMFENENQFVANLSNSELLPPEVVNKVLNIIAKETEEEEIEEIEGANNEIELLKAKLALEIEASYFNF
ncbi:head maturation protease, ClpP-related [Tissierella praeacuta]|uniref:head maturation protease, ClpP-related n=1 Tax=Tissierella praeacuta TaxID=43131 RepID=UPI00333EB13C